MSGEEFNFNHEQDKREQSQNIGAETLAQMPEFNEHMKSFNEAKQNGELPNGVRDEQDYQEYSQEKEAKLNEARSLLWNTYYYEDNRGQEGARYAESLREFLNSGDFKIVVESGFNLEKMFEDGILSKSDGRYADSPIPGLAKRAALDDTEKIIGGLADFCELIADYPGSGDLVNEMQGIFDVWSNNSLSADQYEMIDSWITPRTDLRSRLMYGEINNEDGELVSSTCQVNHILHLIDTLPEIEENYDDNSEILLRLYADKIETKPDGIDQYVHNDIKSAFGEVAHKVFDSVLHASHFDGTARKIAKSVIAPDDFDLMREAKETYGWGDEGPVFSDEELLSSVYNIDPNDKTERLYGSKEIGYKLPRHFGDLEKAGFSRDSLINIIHDKDVPVNSEEVERMREAGVSDADIAYASRAYERFVVDENGKREWHHPIDDNLFHKKEEGYDPAMGLSDTDILNAANRSYWRNERLNKNAE